jgi:Fe-S-cluster-containing hydrogenase component 2
MPKYEIQATAENCSGCLRCQLACSDLHTKRFNPSAARIRVDVSGAFCSIYFTEDCMHCGTCADHCFYDALHKKPRENNA